jgi:hypothetical protein
MRLAAILCAAYHQQPHKGLLAVLRITSSPTTYKNVPQQQSAAEQQWGVAER